MIVAPIQAAGAVLDEAAIGARMMRHLNVWLAEFARRDARPGEPHAVARRRLRGRFDEYTSATATVILFGEES